MKSNEMNNDANISTNKINEKFNSQRGNTNLG